MRSVLSRGILAGWKRRPGNNGILLTLQVAKDQAAYIEKNLDLVEVALNDRQLRSLARDLERAAASRGITLRPQRTFMRQLRHRWLR